MVPGAAAHGELIDLLNQLVDVFSFNHFGIAGDGVVVAGHTGKTSEVAGVPLPLAPTFAGGGCFVDHRIARAGWTQEQAEATALASVGDILPEGVADLILSQIGGDFLQVEFRSLVLGRSQQGINIDLDRRAKKVLVLLEEGKGLF